MILGNLARQLGLMRGLYGQQPTQGSPMTTGGPGQQMPAPQWHTGGGQPPQQANPWQTGGPQQQPQFPGWMTGGGQPPQFAPQPDMDMADDPFAGYRGNFGRSLWR